MPRMSSSPLTRERILRAALRLVDGEGMDGLSMRRLGTRLGVKGTALYHHFANKSEIIDALVARVLSDVDLAPEETNWVRRMRRIMQSQREVMLKHPNLVSAIALRPFSSAEAATIHETMIEVLLSAGLDQQTALHGYNALRAFVVGYALTEMSGLTGDRRRSPDDGSLSLQQLSELGFSQLLNMIPIAARCNRTEDFLLGLEAIMSGLQAESLRQSLRTGRKLD